jgi:hypothetical protein
VPGRTAGAGRLPRRWRLSVRDLRPVLADQGRPGPRSARARPRVPAHPVAPRRRRPARGHSTLLGRPLWSKLERCAGSHGIASSSTPSALPSPERDVFEPSSDLRRSGTIGRPKKSKASSVQAGTLRRVPLHRSRRDCGRTSWDRLAEGSGRDLFGRDERAALEPKSEHRDVFQRGRNHADGGVDERPDHATVRHDQDRS